MTGLGRLAEATRGFAHLLATHGDTVLRYGVRAAADVDRYYAEAAALGVPREEAEALLAEARQQLTEWIIWSFDPTEIARQQMCDIYAAQMPRASEEARRVVRRMFEMHGARFDPVDVDREARRLELGLPMRVKEW